MSAIVGKQRSGIFQISENPLKLVDMGEKDIGVPNLSYYASVTDLPQAVFQLVQMTDINGTGQSISIRDLGLTEPYDDAEESEDDKPSAPRCHHHLTRLAYRFCVDCLEYVCSRCHRIHHSLHRAISCDSLNCDNTEVSEVYAKCIGLAEKYQDTLKTELESLELSLSDSLTQVDKIFEELHARINTKKDATVLRVKDVIAAQCRRISEKMEGNQIILNQLKNSADEDCAASDSSYKGTPRRMFVVPITTLSIEVKVDDLVLPEVDVQIKTVASPVCTEESESPGTLSVNSVNTVGSKGHRELEFRLPGGICVDKENNLYVADEGNNRIQWISKDGYALGSFTWGQKNYLITDVTYDPTCDRLIVPRAYSEHGLLKCSTFSYVTLEGREISRFTVPGMQGGLFTHCGEGGDILITDLVKKSVFVIKDGHVRQEISDLQYLKQPAHSVFGREDEILVVDSSRKVVAVFDMDGLHIRDIGLSEDGAPDMRKPSGVSIDKTCGIIAVTDWSADKVLLYSYQGALLSTVNGFKCPHSVYINDYHRMVVTDCWNNQLKVFSYFPEVPSA